MIILISFDKFKINATQQQYFQVRKSEHLMKDAENIMTNFAQICSKEIVLLVQYAEITTLSLSSLMLPFYPLVQVYAG